MKWILGLFFIGSCVVSGLLGLTAGISLNPESSIKYVPNWGSIADWVAGLGSLAAVGATVYFGWKQRQDLIPKLSIRSEGYMTIQDGALIKSFSSKVVNFGIVPIQIKSVCFQSSHSSECLWADPGFFIDSSDPVPCEIAPGKGASILFSRSALSALKNYVVNNCNGKTDGLSISFISPVRDYVAALSPDIPKIE